jgi:hypothetical protein
MRACERHAQQRTDIKPSLAAALRQVAKLGKSVRSVEITAAGVKLEFGEPQPTSNEWDEVLPHGKH